MLPIEQRRRNLEILFNHTTVVPFKHRGVCLCFFCGLKMKDRQQLVEHSQTHLPCNTRHNSLKVLNVTDYEIKVDVSEIQCKVCSEKFSNIYNVGFHLAHKHKLLYDLATVVGVVSYRLIDLKCVTCFKQLKTLRGLIQHTNKEHPVHYFECDECSKRFRRKHDLLVHINQTHKEEYRCPKCPETFKTKKEYVKHKNVDHISQCNLCFQTFPSSAMRLKHMKGEHDIALGGTCGFCHKKLNSRFAFLDHAGKCTVGGPVNIEVSLTPVKTDTDVKGSFSLTTFVKTDSDMATPMSFTTSVKIDKDMTPPNEAETVTAMSAMRKAKRSARNSIAYVFNNTTVVPFKRYHNRFRCFYCPKEYTSCNDLRNHSVEEHPICDVKLKCMKLSGLGYQYMGIKVDSSILACKLCLDHYADLKALLTHLESEHGAKLGDCINKLIPFKLIDDQYPCPQCGEEFASFGVTLIHFNKEHNTENRVLCVTCGESFHGVTSLQIHKNRCNAAPDRFKCSRCDLGFYNKSQLTRHLGIAHKKKVFKCPLCPEFFASEHFKMTHITKDHKGGHRCTHCDASFMFRSRLIQHIRRLHLQEKNEKCPYCEKTFFDQRRLKNHLVLHTGERAFSCDYCDKTFSWKKNLISHIHVHLKNAGLDKKRKERKQ